MKATEGHDCTRELNAILDDDWQERHTTNSMKHTVFLPCRTTFICRKPGWLLTTSNDQITYHWRSQNTRYQTSTGCCFNKYGKLARCQRWRCIHKLCFPWHCGDTLSMKCRCESLPAKKPSKFSFINSLPKISNEQSVAWWVVFCILYTITPHFQGKQYNPQLFFLNIHAHVIYIDSLLKTGTPNPKKEGTQAIFHHVPTAQRIDVANYRHRWGGA